MRKLFIGETFVAMENHRTDSIPNDSYPVKSDRLLDLDRGSLKVGSGVEDEQETPLKKPRPAVTQRPMIS